MDKFSPLSDKEKKSHRSLTRWLCLLVVLMFGFGFALVPLYDIMCDALGINGKTNSQAVVLPDALTVDTSRTVKVEFMAHITPNLPWRFEPEVTTMNVHPGEVIRTAYIAKNLSTQALVGQAVPSVSPGLAASHFNKIECFCFNQQPLTANGQAEMPLIFYIEPNLPDSIQTLTLSYTLYNITESVNHKEEVTNLPSTPAITLNKNRSNKENNHE
ncbi:cytochrome c oxidase assembly protein [Vibrio sp. 10N.286.49.B3]|uniref:cytochrome c oxidase assembly protein n=1 Tax=Vibrio sp. 10N.286.49.B3 TaxID=1880855 RepID=UPI000C8173AC|nr:cytochrome c oxidase assembly protein [Vibrio sp. 10N.286.49.B3]PMH44533.1 cytochrome c oxidase assembly protein [Vibrio sp. 10N.286.49.B3]